VAFAGNSNSPNFYFSTSASLDTVNPAVTSIVPPHGASGVGVNALAHVTFSEPIDPLTLNATTVALSSGGGIATTLSLDAAGTVLIVTPAVPLPDSASVTITVNGVQDRAGNAAPIATATFTTAAGADVVRPSGASNVAGSMPVNSLFEVVFTEPMDVPSVLVFKDQFLYDNTVGYLTGGTMTFTADGRTMTYVPSANLVAGRSYSINLNSNARDLAGNGLNNIGVGFSGTGVDTTPPQIRAINPGDGLTAVRRNVKIEVLFDEPVDPTSLDSVNVLVSGSPIAIDSRTLSNGNRLLTLTPSALLAANTVHTISIAGIEDVAENQMPTVTTTFTTGSTTDLAGPAAPTFLPVNGSTNVLVGATLSVTFAEAIDPVRVLAQYGGSSSGIYLRLTATSAIVPSTLSFSADYKTVTIVPNSPLAAGTQYQIVSYQIYDMAGNLGGGGFLTSGFTTQP
jgi:Bacterial Ig-like domain